MQSVIGLSSVRCWIVRRAVRRGAIRVAFERAPPPARPVASRRRQCRRSDGLPDVEAQLCQVFGGLLLQDRDRLTLAATSASVSAATPTGQARRYAPTYRRQIE